MSETVTYRTVLGTVEFQYPTVTISHVANLDAAGVRVVSVTTVAVIRAILTADTLEDMEARLRGYMRICSCSRGLFTIVSDAHVLLELNADRDLGRGPHPSQLEIVERIGTRMVRIAWQIRSETTIPSSPSLYAQHAIDFAYTIDTSLDAQQVATKNVAGIIRVHLKPDDADRHRTADSYRQIISDYFQCLPGWLRVSEVFRLAQNKYSLSFSITDQQVKVSPPPGITAWDASLSVGVNSLDPRLQMTLNGFYEAPFDSGPGVVWDAFIGLFNACFKQLVINDSRIRQYYDRSFILERMTTTRSLSRNRLDFNVTGIFMRTANKPISLGSSNASTGNVTNVYDENTTACLEYIMTTGIEWFDRCHELRNRNAKKEAFQAFGRFPNPSWNPHKEARGKDSSWSTEVTAGVAPCFVLTPDETNILAAFPHIVSGQKAVTGKLDALVIERDTVPVVSMHQHLSYAFVYHRAITPAKTRAAVRLIQELAHPELHIIQTGEAVTFGSAFTPPPPIFPTAEPGALVVLLGRPEYTVNTPDAAGRYRTTWRYHMVWKTGAPDENVWRIGWSYIFDSKASWCKKDDSILYIDWELFQKDAKARELLTRLTTPLE